ncbi:MAG: 1-acyl-sn-glycerol-3-phosphate acyltransferase [Methyloprofundus sp.]|nr:1-acyl-sn-glycerol-3-phosphate acyltransferase [Methyloprofundus sp.]MBW6453928.1 1-acyl-sn-glycerol-3-phosphate acyltransferase [Methyloprofundus sp.]
MTPANSSHQGSKLMLYLRSTALFIAIFMVTSCIALAMLMSALLPFEGQYKLAKMWANYILFLTKSICGLDYKISGLENLPQKGVAIVLCKHQSAWETIALMGLLPKQSVLLKKSLLWIPFWGWAMATLKPIAIDRSAPKEALSQLLKQGALRLQEGFWVVMYPEGTRTAPGEERKFSASGSLLAQRTKVTVIPIAHNAGEFWPRNSFVKYPGVIQLKIGAPIAVEGRKSKDINAEAETWIKNTMLEIEATK